MKLDKMNGYEFEDFIGRLFRLMGFNVVNTSLSGDGGIDVVALYPGEIFKGKYIIQCKHWQGTVGEPPVRDLYGVVLSENANKGILITTSDFSKAALQFAQGKNIELINGEILNRIIQQYMIDGDEKKSTVNEAYFLMNSKFDKEKYEYLNDLIAEDKKNINRYVDLLNFLLKYYKNENIKLIHSGLNEQTLETINKFSNQFIKRNKSSKKLNTLVQTLKSYIYLIDGKLSLSLSCLLSNSIYFEVSSGGTVSLVNFNGKYGIDDDYWSQTFLTSTNLVKVFVETGKFNVKDLINDKLTMYNPYTHPRYYIGYSMGKKNFNFEGWIESFISDKVIYCPGGIGDCSDNSWEYIYLNTDMSIKNCVITANVIKDNWPSSFDLDDEVKKICFILKK